MNPSMFARRNIKSDTFLIMDHDAIGTQIYPTFIRILRNVKTARANVTPAIKLVPKGCGERQDVDIIAHLDVFQDWSVINELIRNGRYRLKSLGKRFR